MKRRSKYYYIQGKNCENWSQDVKSWAEHERTETKHPKTNVLNVRNRNCKKEFFKLTSEEGKFTKCLKSHEE